MKKEVVFVFLFLLLLMIFPLVSGQSNSTQETQKINLAYTCLLGKVNTSALCDGLTTEEKIFSVLSVNQCQSQLINASSNSGECWPSGNCNIKTTAQAILALNHVKTNTDKAQAWLLNQTRPTTDLNWYLEVDSSEAAACSVTYGGNSYNFNINEDKTLSGDAGSCLTLAESNYWFRIAPSCFTNDFDVSCDKNFLTTLLFRKSDSSTVHVSPQSSSAAPGGSTIEKVESFCFVQNNVCSYEGTLWASFVLDSLKKDVSKQLPYLLTFAEDNKASMPDMFLYAITADLEHRTALLSKQKSKKWWSESGDKFYDTALALYPFKTETIQEKTNAKEWLLSVQDANGCWENNVRNTAFILASLWPRSFSSSTSGGSGSGTGTTTFSCESSGYSCTTSSLCTKNGGTTLSQYDCSSASVCCSVKPKLPTCADQGGDICSSSQVCIGGTSLSAADVAGQNCCVGGTCQAPSSGEQLSECEISGGTCRSFGCNSGEEESTLYSCEAGGSCCMASTQTESRNLTWVWILLALIVLVVIAIIFRNKLKMLWFKMSKGRSGLTHTTHPGHPPHPPSSSLFPRRIFPVERRIMPTTHQTAHAAHKPAPKPKSTAQKELDDVLKKLKDMSK